MSVISTIIPGQTARVHLPPSPATVRRFVAHDVRAFGKREQNTLRIYLVIGIAYALFEPPSGGFFIATELRQIRRVRRLRPEVALRRKPEKTPTVASRDIISKLESVAFGFTSQTRLGVAPRCQKIKAPDSGSFLALFSLENAVVRIRAVSH